MSNYYDDTYDDGTGFTSPSDDEMLYQMMQQQPFQVPGKTPANQQTFLSSMFNILGYNPISLATAGADAGPASQPFVGDQWVEPLNPEAEIYGKSPLYATAFQAIEDGADPISAMKAAYEASGITPSTEDLTEGVKIATGYATNKVDAENQRLQFDQKSATDKAQWDQKQQTSQDTFTRPDGSKYKNAPLGGTDIYGTASEYDLLGGDSIDQNDLINQYAQSVRPTAMPERESLRSAFTVTKPQGNTNGSKGRGAAPKGAPTHKVTETAPRGGRFSDNAEVDKYAEQSARASIQGRLNRAKNTRVRSDANNNAMRVAMKYAQYMGRPFDE